MCCREIWVSDGWQSSPVLECLYGIHIDVGNLVIELTHFVQVVINQTHPCSVHTPHDHSSLSMGQVLCELAHQVLAQTIECESGGLVRLWEHEHFDLSNGVESTLAFEYVR